MKAIVSWAVLLMLVGASPVLAQTQMAKNTPAVPPASKTTKVGLAKVEAKAEKAETKETSGISEVLAEIQQMRQLLESQARELEAQRALIQEQQAKIEKLEERPEIATGAEPPASEAASARMAAVDELEQKMKSLEADLNSTKKSTEGKLKNLGNFSFSGDLRLRGETFNSGTLSQPRYRARYRLRFNVNAKLNDEMSGGLTIASGEVTDPISTNQTFSQFFTRKYFSVDKAFLSYKPKWFANVGGGEMELVGGKYGYTWYHTELTFDNDLNPEGLSQSVSWKFKNPVFERIAFVGFENFVAESGGGPDTMMYGGQAQLYWKLGNNVRLTTYAGYYNFQNADAIRAAQSNVTARVAGGPCDPIPPSTTPQCVTQGIPNTATLSGSSNSNAATSTQFASKFGLFDGTARLDIKTPSSRWPVMAQINFVQNTRACANLVNISGTPPACNSRDRQGYWAEVQFGALRERGDWNFGYSFIRLEREAILAAFNFSDLRAPTNTVTSRVNVGYQLYRNVQVNWTGLFGRQLVTSSTPTEEKRLRRMQFDLFYKF